MAQHCTATHTALQCALTQLCSMLRWCIHHGLMQHTTQRYFDRAVVHIAAPAAVPQLLSALAAPLIPDSIVDQGPSAGAGSSAAPTAAGPTVLATSYLKAYRSRSGAASAHRKHSAAPTLLYLVAYAPQALAAPVELPDTNTVLSSLLSSLNSVGHLYHISIKLERSLRTADTTQAA